MVVKDLPLSQQLEFNTWWWYVRWLDSHQVGHLGLLWVLLCFLPQKDQINPNISANDVPPPR